MNETNAPPSSTPRPGVIVLCPYCGHTQYGGQKCESCGGLFEPLSRIATQIAMGPWFIRDKTHPFQPGCSLEVVHKMIQTGKLKPHTVMRGPTTHQFWSVAKNVKGIGHLIGYCPACGHHTDPAGTGCDACGEPYVDAAKYRDHLGLQYPTAKHLAKAKDKLARLQNPQDASPVERDVLSEPVQGQSQASQQPAAPQSGAALLDQIVGHAATDPASDVQTSHELSPSDSPIIQTLPAVPQLQADPDFADAQPTAALPDGKRRVSGLMVLLLLLNVLVLGGLLLYAMAVLGDNG